jgi:hypothetical protein
MLYYLIIFIILYIIFYIFNIYIKYFSIKFNDIGNTYIEHFISNKNFF